MENLFIQGSSGAYFVPTVDFNAETGVCDLIGESYLEDTAEFYQPVIEWIEKFIDEIGEKIVFNIKLSYFNTSTARSIMEILNILASYQEQNGVVLVYWYYDPTQDTDTVEEVEDFAAETGLEIQLISTKN